MASIGTQFKEAREAKGATLSQAASATRVKIQHLESMEKDDFSQMAAAAYARGFIKIYAEYLGLSPDPLIRAYAEEHSPSPVRQGLSTDEVPVTRSESAEDEAPSTSSVTWSDLISDAGLMKRILFPVLGIVAVVLILSAVGRWFGDRSKSGPAPVEVAREETADVLAPIFIEEPPAAYLGGTRPGVSQ